MPGLCTCGQNYDVTHAMNCERGGFIIMRHTMFKIWGKFIKNNFE